MLKLGLCGVRKEMPPEVFEKLLNNKHMTVTGVYGCDCETFEKISKKSVKDIQHYTSYPVLLDESDVVFICDSSDFFIRLRQAVEAGVHIIYEFPKSGSEDNLRYMLALTTAYLGLDKVMAAFFPRRCDIIFSNLKSMILSQLEKEYGALTEIVINTRCYPRPSDEKHHLFMDNFIYDVDVLNFLLGTGEMYWKSADRKERNYSVKGYFVRSRTRHAIQVKLDAFYVKEKAKSGTCVTLRFANGEVSEYRNFGSPYCVNTHVCEEFIKQFIAAVNTGMYNVSDISEGDDFEESYVIGRDGFKDIARRCINMTSRTTGIASIMEITCLIGNVLTVARM